ncbi:hypothetical protein [Herbaspirillum frisingense]|nr:hypothetical protein [Herbaspirillum frisingense]UIN20846.1 hypothetical protein LAZ82_20610 [Herbaspirillum frisingense]
MTAFRVVVRTESARHSYTAIAVHSCDVIAAAVDRFGVCSVTATKEKNQ